MNALILLVALASTPEGVGMAVEPDVAQPERQTNFSLSFSPLSTLLLGAAIEAEFRVDTHLTGYLVGEFYGAWMGWGAQSGLRWYPHAAFKGFFVDAHARAGDLGLNHLIGGGLEIGSQHTFGRSRWAILWAVGADAGAGSWRTFGAGTVDTWLQEGFTVIPKVRLMIGYHF